MSEKRLTGTVFLDVAKTFSIFSYLYDMMLEASFESASCTRHGMRAGVDQGRIFFHVLFSLYVKDMPTPSHHVGLALYADDTAVLTTSRQPALLVSIFK